MNPFGFRADKVEGVTVIEDDSDSRMEGQGEAGTRGSARRSLSARMALLVRSAGKGALGRRCLNGGRLSDTGLDEMRVSYCELSSRAARLTHSTRTALRA